MNGYRGFPKPPPFPSPRASIVFFREALSKLGRYARLQQRLHDPVQCPRGKPQEGNKALLEGLGCAVLTWGHESTPRLPPCSASTLATSNSSLPTSQRSRHRVPVSFPFPLGRQRGSPLHPATSRVLTPPACRVLDQLLPLPPEVDRSPRTPLSSDFLTQMGVGGGGARRRPQVSFHDGKEGSLQPGFERTQSDHDGQVDFDGSEPSCVKPVGLPLRYR